MATTIRDEKYSGGEFADSSDKRKAVEFGSEQDTEQLCNSSKEKISLGCDGVEGFSSLKAENRFKGADGTLNGGTLGIKGVPFVRIANETGIKAMIGIGINVNTATVGRIGARRIAEAASGCTLFRLDELGLRANEFEAFGTVFAGT